MPAWSEGMGLALGDKAGAILPIGGQSCKSQSFALVATLDYLMGEFHGGRTTADGCREWPFLAAIVQELKPQASAARRCF